MKSASAFVKKGHISEVKKYFILLVFFCLQINGQKFYFGNDLSYVNQMEDCGAVFKENGETKDVYKIFADHGTNLVRMRLWVDPTWQNSLVQPEGVKNQYSDFDDVRETIQRSKEAGMEVMLDLHLSDFWTDPGKQLIPARWVGVANNLTALKDSVYNYVIDILTVLNKDTLMPEIIKVGNENNGGILRHTTLKSDYTVTGSVSTDWSRHAQLYNSAIKAIRDFTDTTAIKPKISLHCADPADASWFYQNIISKGVTDFDIMGFSYYYAWHGSNIATVGNIIKSLKTKYPAYEVMIVETGYLWSTINYDGMGNIITTPDPQYLPVNPEKQLEYFVDLTRAVMNSGGTGVIFWESAWVSTPCRTPWGKGSSHDHVVFFDPVNTNFMENGAGVWPESAYYQDLTTKKITFKVDMTGQDVSKGVYITGSWTGNDWKILPMVNEESNIFSYVTYLPQNDSGAFYFLNDTTWNARETVPSSCAIWWGTDRGYKVGTKDIVVSAKWESCGTSASVNTQTERKDLSLFPNPNNGFVFMKFSAGEKPENMELFDFSGKLIRKINLHHFDRTTYLNISDLPSGIYFLKVYFPEYMVFKKLVYNRG